MPSNKGVNLTKLKSSTRKTVDSGASGQKKQVTISKFFSTKSEDKVDNPRPTDDDVEIIIDDSKHNSGCMIKEKKISSPFKKRPRESDVEHHTNGSATKRLRLGTSKSSEVEKTSPSCSDSKHTHVMSKEVAVVKKDQDSDLEQSSEPCTSTGNQSKDLLRKLNSATLTKLKKFEISSESDLSDPKCIDLTTLKRSKHFLNFDIDEGKKESRTASENEECMEIDIDSQEDEVTGIQPSTSKSGSQKSSVSKTFSSTKNKSPVNKKTKSKYTPLEQQYLDIKEKYSDCVLFVECGYKYRFFGDDAEVAAKVLKIFCHPDHNFMTASIPTHRLFVHVRRLVSAGYKVGVVKQTETAALKAAGDNRGAPFTRQLSAIYTKSTLIGEDPLSGMEESGSGETTSSGISSYLMCVYDVAIEKTEKKHSIGILAVQPATGDVIYDCFEDNDMRGELETRISHIQPVEMIVPHTLTEKTEKLIDDIVFLSHTDDDRLRVDKVEDNWFDYNKAFEIVSEFYSDDEKDKTDEVSLQQVVNLPKPVLCCLSAVIMYLKDFNLDKVLTLTCNFKQFSTKSQYMQLSGNTVRNLELFYNQTNGLEKGSLFSIINQTVTKFGGRLLRSWLTRPLLSASEIKKRQNAVTELLDGPCSDVLGKLRATLVKTPDLEKGLCSVFHKKCSTQEFYIVSKSLANLCQEVKTHNEAVNQHLTPDLLRIILTDVPELLEDVEVFSDKLNEKSARENDKTTLFCDESQFPEIVKRKKEITDVLEELNAYRREVRLQLKQPSLEYVTVLGTEFLVEVKNTQLNLVPKDWNKISSTKAVSRFHTPFIVGKYKSLNQLREQLVMDANQAWMQFLDWFGENYQRYKKAVQHLATLDCLFSLATTARHHGYCKPDITETETCIHIDQGRHPVIDQLLGEHDQFVPNSTQLSTNKERVMVITGPNMGGKSSYIKQVGLIAVLSQIGSYVPAESAKLGILDAIHTRMGATDDIYKGRSTFMVELQEASEIISQATPRSLVILDELGRGTSTHDGVAIACATLNFFITQTKCMTLFVTHYPMLSEFENTFPEIVRNYHMSFLLNEDSDGGNNNDVSDVITFLYQLVSGSAARSYGLNVARLADIPTDILNVATHKSHSLEEIIAKRRKQIQLFQSVCGDDKLDSDILFQNLRAILSPEDETR